MYTTIRMFGNSKIFSPKMKNDHHLLIWYDFLQKYILKNVTDPKA